MNSLFHEGGSIEYLPNMDRDGCQALFIPVGIEKKSFAYLGMPEGEESVPAVILIHGGGGTAYTTWVNQWARRGYAALAVDIEGAAECYCQKEYRNLGLIRNGDFLDSNKPKEDQWMYQVILTVMRAKLFLEGHSRIISQKIGLMGISWGGLAAANVISYDPGFSFCIAVYGCGCCKEESAYFGRVFRGNPRASLLWNALERLQGVQAPTLWVNGDNDDFFSILSTSRCKEAMPNARLAIIPGFSHGHEPAWELEIPYFFADSICKSGTAFPSIHIETADCNPQTIAVQIEEGDSAKTGHIQHIQIITSPQWFLYDSYGHGCTPWQIRSEPVPHKNTFQVCLLEKAALVYINCIDKNGAVYSSNVISFSYPLPQNFTEI